MVPILASSILRCTSITALYQHGDVSRSLPVTTNRHGQTQAPRTRDTLPYSTEDSDTSPEGRIRSYSLSAVPRNRECAVVKAERGWLVANTTSIRKPGTQVSVLSQKPEVKARCVYKLG